MDVAAAESRGYSPWPDGVSSMTIVDRLLGFKRNPRVHKIPGGIKPPAFKASSLRSRIMPTPIPRKLIMPLLQHQGVAACPVVAVGDRVLKYQLLAEARGTSSVALHAPTSASIVEISNTLVANGSAELQLCILLEPDGADVAVEITPIPDYRALSHLQLLELVKAAGICGMGGAGFPLAEKLRLSIDKGVELLIINAAECEPYISADEALIRERAELVVAGSKILQSICLASRCIIAIADDKTAAITALVNALQNSSIELVQVRAKYSIGGEKQLIQAVTGVEVPVGKLPSDIGVLMQNVGTAYAVYEAIVEGRPCISRITTVTGSPLITPKNFETLIGTPVSFLFDLCGIDKSAHTGSIMGGSLMGIALPSTKVPVVKTTNCLIATCAEEFPPAAPEQACIRCGFCATACPVSLLPQQLYAFARSREQDQLIDYGLFDCIECGACAYVCPSQIPLVQYYRASKAEIHEHRAQQLQSAHWQTRFQYHQYRLKEQKDEARERKSSRIETQAAKTSNGHFSRVRAREEIADAVARVKARKSKFISSSNIDQEKKD